MQGSRLCTPPPYREATIGGYEAFDEEAAALRRPYTALAALLNCRPNEIAIVSSATAAWQQVVYGLAWGWRAGDRVLVSVAEYGSNVISLLQLAKCARGVGGWAAGCHSSPAPATHAFLFTPCYRDPCAGERASSSR